jgi:hypothetical protein
MASCYHCTLCNYDIWEDNTGHWDVFMKNCSMGRKYTISLLGSQHVSENIQRRK